MNSDCRNRALEAWLVGHWTCSGEHENCEYAFLADNQFTCLVTRPGESPFKLRGYWEILGEQLRIGTSPLAADPAQIAVTGIDSFTAALPSGSTMRFQKVYSS